MSKQKATERQAGELFDLLAAAPQGLRLREIVASTGWNKDQIRKVIRTLRLMLGDSGDTISVPCTPNGQGEEWTYQLASGYDDTKEWIDNRIVDTGSRIVTMLATMSSCVEAEKQNNPRSVKSKRARVMKRGLSRIVEDLAELG